MNMMSWGKEVVWNIVLCIAECSLRAGKSWRISCVIHALVIWSLVKQSRNSRREWIVDNGQLCLGLPLSLPGEAHEPIPEI